MSLEFSQIAAAGTIAASDTIIGVQARTTDVQYTVNAIAGAVAAVLGITQLGTGSIGVASLVASASVSSPSYIVTSSNIVTESTTARNLTAGDNGRTIVFTNGSAVTVTIPTGLGAGFAVLCLQTGTGQVGFTVSGTTLNSFQNVTHIAGQYGVASLFAPSANSFVLAGNIG